MMPKKINQKTYFDILRYTEASNTLKMIWPILTLRLFPEDFREFADHILMELDDE